MSAPPRSNRPLALLAGLTPAEFMRRHWQKRPLLIRGAVPGSRGGFVTVRPAVKAKPAAAKGAK